MVTLKTAQKITEVCSQIDECKRSLVLLKNNKKIADNDSVFISIYKNDGDCISIPISLNIAKETLNRQLSSLQAEYLILNENIYEESKPGRPDRPAGSEKI